MILRGQVHVEEVGMGRTRLVVTEIPYQTNKTHLIERIVQVAQGDLVNGIVDVRDESDRTGMRICIELNKLALAPEVLSHLYRLTPLQQTFSLSLVALVDGVPQRLSLREMLVAFLQHRQTVVRRRSVFERQAARTRLHVVEGLLQALARLDEVIRIIRDSRQARQARGRLRRQFGFSQAQVEAILAMPLRQLVGMEQQALRKESQTLTADIQRLAALLGSDTVLRQELRKELQQVKATLTDARRTRIEDMAAPAQVGAHALAPVQRVWVAVGQSGTVKCFPFRGMQRGRFMDIGRQASLLAVTAQTCDFLYLFGHAGVCHRVEVGQCPDQGAAQHVGAYTGFTRRDGLAAVVALPAALPAGRGHVCLVTRKGVVKRIQAHQLAAARTDTSTVLALAAGDELGWVLWSEQEQDLMLFTAQGQTLRFAENTVRAMGFAAAGVQSLQVAAADTLVAVALAGPDSEVLTVTAAGFAKRTPVAAFPRKGRIGKGVIGHRITPATGEMVGACTVAAGGGTARAALHGAGQTWLVDVAQVPEFGRAASGQRIPMSETPQPIGGLTLLWADEAEL